MNDSTSPSRASAAEMAATRERSARAEFAAKFEPESPDVSAQERGLRKDAHDLSPAGISTALLSAGCDPVRGCAACPRRRRGR